MGEFLHHGKRDCQEWRIVLLIETGSPEPALPPDHPQLAGFIAAEGAANQVDSASVSPS